MEVLTIVQVGDIHFPEHDRPDADIKDSALTPSLVDAATASELQATTRAVLEVTAAHPSALLAFTGDLTSRGDLDAYSRCVDYLDRAFLLSDKTRWPNDRVHAVPGNHDVNRELASHAPAGDLYFKFQPLTQIWMNQHLPVLATTSVRATRLQVGDCAVDTYGLNSCLGCGEHRRLPEAAKAAVERAMSDAGVDSAISTAVMTQTEKDFVDVIDAPAYAEVDLADVCDSIRHATEPMLSIVVAHHNLLQQAQPRFDLYTDVINGGMVRSRLTSLDRPILYLHGHIHSDPVESVTQLAPDAGQLICISAPEFHRGFNRIDVHFASDGTPIGCVVLRYRVRLDGGTSLEPSVRIPFHRYEMPLSPTGAMIAAHLLGNPGCASLLELVRDLDTAENTLDQAAVASAVEEAEWLGLVEILNRDRPVRNWRLRVVTRRD